ncbi:hypothetical protein LVD15_03645 [Fulvivirga maritima]|uniref:hypothetical protein n=1 Tax=Fulvivirga maritima TaxID=2904247 RepID=UPI001F4235D7|nr:hypothetical protein [Fulvivirga maritima]UII27537.1 hypothetical protein LVD15_03645 [Fulvivirga maritima]
MDGDLVASYDLPTSIAEETDLIAFVKNMESGYTLILEDSATRELIRMDLNEDGHPVDEYKLPITKVRDLYEPVFYVKGDLLMILHDNYICFEKDIKIWEEPKINSGAHSVVEADNDGFLIIGNDMEVTYANIEGVKYTVDYAHKLTCGILPLGDNYFLVGIEDLSIADDLSELQIIKIDKKGALSED